jgi:hypothetical protein
VLDLDLVQDSTGGRLLSFFASDVMRWENGQAPSINTIHTYPGTVNEFRFVAGLDGIRAKHLNPKPSGAIIDGAALIQLAALSFLGSSTVSKRLPLSFGEGEVQTTDATETTLGSIPVELNTTIIALSLITGARSTGAESFTALILSGWRRGSSGNVAEIASEVVIGSLEDSSGTPSALTDVDTTNQLGRIRVTGEASKTFNWAHYTVYFKVTQ